MGVQIHTQAQAMGTAAFAVERLARASQEPLNGQVTLNAPPVLVTHVLAARLVNFRADCPGKPLDPALPREIVRVRHELPEAERVCPRRTRAGEASVNAS